MLPGMPGAPDNYSRKEKEIDDILTELTRLLSQQYILDTDQAYWDRLRAKIDNLYDSDPHTRFEFKKRFLVLWHQFKKLSNDND